MKFLRFVQIAVSPVIDWQGPGAGTRTLPESILPDLYGLTDEGGVFEYSDILKGWKPLPMIIAEAESNERG